MSTSLSVDEEYIRLLLLCRVSGCPIARKLRAERSAVQRQSSPVSMAALPPVAPPAEEDEENEDEKDVDDDDEEEEEIAVDQPSDDECEPAELLAMNDSAAVARGSMSSPEFAAALPIPATQ